MTEVEHQQLIEIWKAALAEATKDEAFVLLNAFANLANERFAEEATDASQEEGADTPVEATEEKAPE